MAIMIPSIPQDFTPASGEDKIFYALQNLPRDTRDKKNDYYVFHSFKINRVNEENILEQHEIDFVIFHPEKGILCLECKNGKIMAENREWYFAGIDKRGMLKRKGKKPMQHGGPFRQAENRMRDLMHELLQSEIKLYADEKEKLKDHCKFIYGVCLPGVESLEEEYDTKTGKIKFEDFLGTAECPKDMVIFGEDLRLPEILKKKIDKLFDIRMQKEGKDIETGYDRKRLQDEDIKNLFDQVLCPNFHIVETLDPNTGEKKYIRLNEDQIRVLDIMETKKVMAVSGWAGTGKTILALEIAKRKALQLKREEKVLFFCINSLMKEELGKLCLSKRIVFRDVNCFAKEVLAKTDVQDKQSFSEEEKQQLQKIIKEKIETEKFKTIIIDEGQDYNNELKSCILQALYCVSQNVNEQNKKEDTLKEKVEHRLKRTVSNGSKKSFYIFYDEFQSYGGGKLPEFISDIKNHFELEKNYRNTENIAQTAFKPITDQKLDGHCVKKGIDKEEKVKISFYENAQDLRRQLDNILQYLNPDETVILTCKNDDKDDSEKSILLTLPEKELKEIFAEEVQENPVKKYVRDKREDNETAINRKEFLFTCWEKFKGLEKRNVILIDFEPLSFLDRNNEAYYRYFYVGITRAQERVYILSSLRDSISKYEEIKTDEGGNITGVNYVFKTAKAEKSMYDNIFLYDTVPDWVHMVDEKDLHKYAYKISSIKHNENLMQELGEEIKKKGNCLAFAVKWDIPPEILKEEYDRWVEEEPKRELEQEIERVYGRINPKFVNILDNAIAKDEQKPGFYYNTRNGIAKALYAEDIFDADVLLNDLLTNLTKAVKELDEKILKNSWAKDLNKKFCFDISEMIDFWNRTFGDVLDYDIIERYGNNRVNSSVLYDGFRFWSEYVCNKPKATLDKSGKIFSEAFWENYRRIIDLWHEHCECQARDEELLDIDLLDNELDLFDLDNKESDSSESEELDPLDTIHSWKKYCGWNKYNKESYPNTLLEMEIEVMEHYFKTYARFKQGFPGISHTEPSDAIKSMLSGYLKNEKRL